jgi:hypothetical protein
MNNSKFDDVDNQNRIKPNDFYEDAFYHPCICVRSDYENDIIFGISLIDGSYPRSCSLVFSGIRKLSLREVVHWKFFGPLEAGDFNPPWINGFDYENSDNYFHKLIKEFKIT